MFTLSGFADEVSPDLNEQLAFFAGEGLGYLELRSIWSKNVADLSDAEVERIRGALRGKGIRVSSIGSPIGKIEIGQPFEPHLERFRRVVELAHRFEAPYIRVFSFYIPEGDEPGRHRDEILRRLAVLLDSTGDYAGVLVLENEHGLYGDVPERCLELLRSVGDPRLRLCFDAGNFVHEGIHPFAEAFEPLQDYIAYIHVKDSLFGQEGAVPAGEGDGEYPAILGALGRRSYQGFLSLEPHLSHGGSFGGFTGPELFRTAVTALKRVLEGADLEYR